ncbi:hypothetical protein LZ554_008386 [Drepanopeziza brunnea f. sp. 'monogermtubi']|nr:hypothetical protein LZ554_008386 [Drepanopeziza brunnea f. sp. 'monogermtubi']
MASPSSPASIILPVFTKFSCLPVEIRCQIWAFAAPSRPRVIQIAYNPEAEEWRSYPDACGGLPKIIPVCREARQEALKPYTRMLETWVDLEEDTIFISDPVFTVRKPRSVFMDSDYVGRIKRVALTNDVYMGLKQVHELFPSLLDGPGAVLRKMGGLSHLSLVLMEDGGDYDDESDWEDIDFDGEFPPTPSGEPNEVVDRLDAEDDEEDEDGQDDEGTTWISGDVPGGGAPEDLEEEEVWLSYQEEEAMGRMSKGYFRHAGDIHFESATHSQDHWDSWHSYFEQVEVDFAEQQTAAPQWRQPMVSIVEVKYGLNYIGRASTLDWTQPGTGEDAAPGEDEDSAGDP